MILATTEQIAGHRVVQTLGEVFGIDVRSRGIIPDVTAQIRSIFGGEITEYSELLETSRNHAIDRMAANAKAKGANAVVMMRFDSSSMHENMSEIVAYGTAVVIEPLA